MNIMTPCTQWTSLDMQKNASKVRLVHHHVQPVFPSISEFFIWGFVAVTSCLVPMNGHPHAPHVRCAMEVLYLGSEIIWEDYCKARQHMSIKKSYAYQEYPDNTCLSLPKHTFGENLWFHPGKLWKTGYTLQVIYQLISRISTYTPWKIVISNYYPSGQKKTALEEAPLQKLRIPGQWRCRKRFDTARGSYKVVPPFDS